MIWNKLLNINRYIMYSLLLVTVAIPLFFKGVVVPTITSDNTEDLYIFLNRLEPGSTVFLESDWTVSTRGESRGQLEAVLKIMAARDLKFVLYSCADPQAPQVAMNVLNKVNADLKARGLPYFEPWEDFIEVGFFPDIEAFYQVIASNPVKAFGAKTFEDPVAGRTRPIAESPVLRDIKRPQDVALVLNITASGTTTPIIQRIGGTIPIAACVTGVMGPENLNFYAAGQLVGLSIGLRGIVELETMMARGVNHSEEGARPFVEAKQLAGSIPPMDSKFEPYALGMQYFVSLHTALTLLILAVIVGNVGVFMTKRKRAGA